jgi:hypothetical protein
MVVIEFVVVVCCYLLFYDAFRRLNFALTSLPWCSEFLSGVLLSDIPNRKQFSSPSCVSFLL